MTTIKFRRDTSANWTSVNPIPAQGEPCYETDTGKLKIGNGSDNYVTLPYVSDGGGGSTPTNMVTTDTAQTITGSKTFTRGITATDIYSTGEITFNSTSQQRYINNIDTISGGYHNQNGYLTFKGDTTLVGDNKLVLDGRTGGLKLTAASSSSITCENTLIAPEIRTATNKKYLTEGDVDNQTIQIVEGKLHANFDEINGEISNVSSRVTTLETQVRDVSTTLDSNTTDIEDLKKTKNDNIFDISKFTVVGNPTITEDGVASGFSTSNYLRYLFAETIDLTKQVIMIDSEYIYNTKNNSIVWYTNNDYWRTRMQIYSKSVTVYFSTNTLISCSTLNNYLFKTGDKIRIIVECNNTYIKITLYINGIYNNSKTTTYSSPITDSLYTNVANIAIGGCYNAQYTPDGSIDLKQFSITVDGKEVFNGLMSSTKPIYDAIKTNNTELSAFKVETSNDFSAVNSALNEKANLSDLSKCASLADFNRLSATVTALEGRIRDISAVLDNINGR